MVMKPLPSLFIAFALTISSAAAQTPQTVQTPQTPPGFFQGSNPQLPEMLNSLQTREMLRQIMRQYSPTLGEVFRMDPVLMTNQEFLAPYPKLAAFLAQHPEIVHNPSFFVGDVFTRRVDTPEERSYEMFQNVMAGMAVFTGAMIMLSVLCWIVKTFIDHRRWLRVSKVQSEVHSKLLDRFASNQDLLAYIQTSAGRHFLESAPISVDPGLRGVAAPAGRILFSVQAGIVLTLAGTGLHIVSRSVAFQELAQPLFVVGMLATAVGIGFVLSAGAAYVLSRRLGLLDQRPLSSPSANVGVSPPDA
jgi:hypothetical protein